MTIRKGKKGMMFPILMTIGLLIVLLRLFSLLQGVVNAEHFVVGERAYGVVDVMLDEERSIVLAREALGLASIDGVRVWAAREVYGVNGKKECGSIEGRPVWAYGEKLCLPTVKDAAESLASMIKATPGMLTSSAYYVVAERASNGMRVSALVDTPTIVNIACPLGDERIPAELAGIAFATVSSEKISATCGLYAIRPDVSVVMPDVLGSVEASAQLSSMMVSACNGDVQPLECATMIIGEEKSISVSSMRANEGMTVILLDKDLDIVDPITQEKAMLKWAVVLRNAEVVK